MVHGPCARHGLGKEWTGTFGIDLESWCPMNQPSRRCDVSKPAFIRSLMCPVPKQWEREVASFAEFGVYHLRHVVECLR